MAVEGSLAILLVAHTWIVKRAGRRLQTPEGGINQIAAVEEAGAILDGLKRKRKDNWEQGACWGCVVTGFACILDSAEKLGKGRNMFGRNMTVIILFHIAGGQGVMKSLPQHLCRSCYCPQPSPNYL